jgi:hypothetical protein
MDSFRIAQIVYILFFFLGTGILAGAVLTVVTWPRIRGRGLLVAALSVRLLAIVGYLLMGLAQLVSLLDLFESGLPVEAMQGVYMLLAVTSLLGDGLLLFSVISLAGALRNITSRASLADPKL